MANSVYIAFLRGINVGGHSKVPMADLKACFADMGYSNVKTYINSGNVIFTADDTDVRELEMAIEAALEKTFSFAITVVVRTMMEMEYTVQHLPEKWQQGAVGLRCYIIYLRHTIDSPKTLEQLHPHEGVEEVVYSPGVLFWSTRLDALTKSTMAKIIGTPFYKDMTIRNLNTTRKVYDLMRVVD